MLRKLGVGLAAASLALLGWAGTAGAVTTPATVTPTTSPTRPPICPPSLPIVGSVTATTATTITVAYTMVMLPPCGYDTPMTVTAFGSREDAVAWSNPVSSATGGPERIGTITVEGLTPNTGYWYRFSDESKRRDGFIGGPVWTAPF